MFAKYDKFGYRTAALCTRVREIQRIRSSSGCNLHTCPRNTIDLNSVRRKVAIKAAAFCTRVREIPQIRISNGSTLHTCSRNKSNSDIERQHFAHVFEKYDEFGAQVAALCTRGQEIRRIRSSSGCILHTWSRNTTNSAALCTRVREIRFEANLGFGI